jgi:tight adherence protein B
MNETILRVLVLVFVFGSVLLLAETLINMVIHARSKGRAINQRLEMISRGTSRSETLTLLKREGMQLAAALPPLLKQAVRAFERMLVGAGITMPSGRLLTLFAIAPLAILAFIIVAMLAAGSPVGAGRLLLVATVALVLGLVAPLMLIQARAQRRRRKMEEQFPVALDVFVRALRAGHPVASALDLLTVEMPDPIGSQFGIVVDEVTYGADLRDALLAMADRWDLPDLRMFVVSLSVQHETGGNLAEILENLGRVIRERHSMLMKVRALSSEGRMTAVMLTLLPVLTFAGLFVINPAFYLAVSDDPMFVPGFGFLIILYLVGFVTIRRMVDLKV